MLLPFLQRRIGWTARRGAAPLLALILLFGGLCAPARARLQEVYRSHLYVVSVGINQYPNLGKQYTLQFCVSDATAITAALQKGNPPHPSIKQDTFVHAVTLTDAGATRARIFAALQAVAKEAGPEDTFLFFFAGYTATSEDGQLRLLPQDTDSSRASGDIDARTLAGLFQRIPARNQIILLDAPGRSAKAVHAFVQVASGGTAPAEERELAGRSMTVMAPGVSMESTNPNKDGHGEFTLLVLRALTRAADANKDGTVTLAEFTRFVAKMWDGESGDLYTDQKLLAEAGEFPLVRVDKPTSPKAVEPPLPPDTTAIVGLVDPSTKEIPRGTKGNAPPAPEPKSAKGRDFALLVGCTDYDDKGFRRLPNAVVDVEQMAKTLGENFHYAPADVQILKSPTYSELLAALKALQKRTFAPGDQLLLYFAGHGDYDKDVGDGFLVCKNSVRDAQLGEAKTLQYSNLRAIADKIPCPHVFVVLDACFAGSFDLDLAQAADRGPEDKDTTINRDPAEYIRRKMPRRSRKMLTSGRLISVSDGKPGEGSPFVRRLQALLIDRADRGKMLTFNELTSALEGSNPEPHFGDFGKHDPGGDFIFLP